MREGPSEGKEVVEQNSAKPTDAPKQKGLKGRVEAKGEKISLQAQEMARMNLKAQGTKQIRTEYKREKL